MSAAVLVRGLRKQYGELEAVAGIDLEVAPGEVFGFLGPNGAGKTTVIKMLTGILAPTSGRGWVAAGSFIAQVRCGIRRLPRV